MTYTLLGCDNDIALLTGEEQIVDAQSALDVMMSARYETACSKLIFSKDSFAEDFFVLSTGLAGAVLQKFVNYRMKVAIVGDYSKYTSKPLKDFIYESNKGNDIFFVSTREEAVQKLDGTRF